MLVDDSAVVRGLVGRAFEKDPAVEVVTTAFNGKAAIDALGRHDVEVIVLDVEMPVMDGLAALPELLRADPSLQIIMSSTLTQRNAQISVTALTRGAADYIAKPSGTGALTSAVAFMAELLEKVKVLGAALRAGRGGGARSAAGTAPTGARQSTAAKLTLRAPGRKRPQVLAIGSSTGGPHALLDLFGHLMGSVSVPILITQHMPPNFTKSLAEHLGRKTGAQCREAIDGEPVKSRRIYVAPGDFHMKVQRQGAGCVIRLDRGPQVNFCRPAVDVMLRSMVTAYQGAVLATILTGMGHDGRAACDELVAEGGTVIAQDEATSVVWGMPGAVATAGVCSAVLPLANIWRHILGAFQERAA